MKVYLPRWARKAATEALFGAAISRQLKLNKPQQMQVVRLCQKLQSPLHTVDLGRQDRKFLAKRLVPYFNEVEKQARAAFRPFYRILLRPRRFLIYLVRVKAITLLFRAAAGGEK
jgi:hypothetical protein